jgi:hypothetical protein
MSDKVSIDAGTSAIASVVDLVDRVVLAEVRPRLLRSPR